MGVDLDAVARPSLLIVKMSSIGDVVHALPVAPALRRRYPQARISWAVEQWVAPLLAGHPAVDHVIELPPMQWRRAGRSWWRAFARGLRDLRAQAYDATLDLQGLLKSAVVTLLSGAPVRVGMHGQREGAWLASRSIPHPPQPLHVVDDYLRCAGFLGAAPTPVSFGLAVHPAAAESVAMAMTETGIPLDRPLIVINPSASTLSKTWPVERWAAVACALAADGAVVLVGGREATARHAAVHRQASGRLGRLYDFTGRTTLAELVALLDRCALHIAPDTGSAHIAAALGKPVVGLYGPTLPWRKAPYGQGDLVVRHDDSCGRACPRLCLRGRRCLQAARPTELIEQARRVLARGQLTAGIT